jgi:GNAT superfamily N-acetyltransferase
MAGTDRGLLAGVRRLARERGVLDRMSLPGYLQAEEKARALREHSVFLNTTRVDNTPVSVIEAMAAGLPVVATNVGGMSDLLKDGRAGLLVKDGDASGLALAMSTILDDAELRARLVQSGAEVAAHFAPEAVVQAWTSLLESVGVPSRVTQDRSCGSLGLNDLDDVVDIHCEAFPDSAVTHLGRAVVHRYYRWQFTGPHPSPVALGTWDEGQLVGFLFGGVRRGAVSGFARQSAGPITWGALCHPHAVLRLSLPKAVAVGRALLRSHRKKPVPGQVHTLPSDGGLDTVARSFGILSLAVSLAARGSGAAAKLVADAEARAIIAGCGQMNLSVDPANHRAIRFYEKLGWQRSPDGSTWNGAMIKPLSIDEQEVDGLQGIHRVDDREC